MGVNASQKWLHTPTIPILERLKRGDPEFGASMDSIVSKKKGRDDKRKQTNKIDKATLATTGLPLADMSFTND